MAELIPRLAGEYEIHVYSQRVEDVDPALYTLHRIPRIRGPHLLNYLWWFAANHLWRWRDRTQLKIVPDLVYSPGVNCLDPDVVTVHVVFSELREHLAADLRLPANAIRSWPRVLHQRLYYRLIAFLERRIYAKPGLVMGGVSQRAVRELERLVPLRVRPSVVYCGIDREVFCPAKRVARRDEARGRFGLTEETLALLLIGNGWRGKGIYCLLSAASQLKDLAIELIVVGRDERAPFEKMARELGIHERVHLLDSSPDVMQFYAACDVYVGPSLYDTFALPVAEAMACGLPVIASRHTIAPEIMRHGESGLILEEPESAEELAGLIRQVACDSDLRQRLGEDAARAVTEFTWDRNAAEIKKLFEQVCPPRACA